MARFNAQFAAAVIAACRRVAAVAVTMAAAAPPALAADVATGLEGPDVTIIESKERTVYEYRQNGQLRMVKIVPRFGRPYYLAPADPTRGFGDLEKADMLIPRWIIIEF